MSEPLIVTSFEGLWVLVAAHVQEAVERAALNRMAVIKDSEACAGVNVPSPT